MTHLIGYGEVVGKPRPKMMKTRCGRMAHRRWVLLEGTAECPRCSPTLDTLMRQVVALPREIARARKRLKVAA